jgi:hypothetical protein
MALPLLALAGPILDIAGKVLDRVIPDKASADKAKLELLAAAQTQEFQLALEQIKTNQEEAKHSSIFVAGWRPFIGWTCGIGLMWNFLGHPMAVWAAELWRPEFTPPALLGDNLMELTLAMLGMAGLRSWEKFKNVARP